MGQPGERVIYGRRLLRRLKSSTMKKSGGPADIRPSAMGASTPDLAISIQSKLDPSNVSIFAASCIGRSHEKAKTPRQDAFFVFQWGPFIVCGVSDGVSSSEYSHLGSNIVAEHAASLISETLSRQLHNEVATWKTINVELSKKLVNKYVEWTMHKGESVPKELTQLREVAADLFATTLEFIILDTSAQQEEEYPYLYVRICGDGNAFKGSQKWSSEIESLLPGSSEPKGKVGALPAFDGEPFSTAGKISKGQTLLICTDGIGDFLGEDRVWLRKFKRIARRRSPGFEQIVDFVAHKTDGGFDDQTAIFIKL